MGGKILQESKLVMMTKIFCCFYHIIRICLLFCNANTYIHFMISKKCYIFHTSIIYVCVRGYVCMCGCVCTLMLFKNQSCLLYSCTGWSSDTLYVLLSCVCQHRLPRSHTVGTGSQTRSVRGVYQAEMLSEPLPQRKYIPLGVQGITLCKYNKFIPATMQM